MSVDYSFDVRGLRFQMPLSFVTKKESQKQFFLRFRKVLFNWRISNRIWGIQSIMSQLVYSNLVPNFLSQTKIIVKAFNLGQFTTQCQCWQIVFALMAPLRNVTFTMIGKNFNYYIIYHEHQWVNILPNSILMTYIFRQWIIRLYLV